MSKIIKSGFVSFLDQKKTIDVNHHRIINKTPEEEAESIEEASVDDADIGDALTAQQAPEPPAFDKEAIILSAREESDMILQEAKEEAEQIKAEAYQAGYDKGYEEGQQALQAQIQSNNQALEASIQSNEQAYLEQVAAIEPHMVQLVMDLVEKMVGQVGAHQETIAYIIRQGFQQIELTGHITLKVSEADYQYVLAMQKDIFQNMSAKTTTEILLDYGLEKNDCIIETDLGNINCSLGEQMKGLIGELSLIRKSLMKSQDD